MSEQPARHHISSAIVVARPGADEAVAMQLADMDGVEVHAREGGKIVIVIEGPGPGVLGETLIRISSMEGVMAAHMVFEQFLEEHEVSHDDRTDAA